MNVELTECSDGVVVRVRVQPNAKRSEFLGVHSGALKIAIAATPVDGQANAALVEYLRTTLGVKRSQVQLIRGETSRDKVFLLRNVTADQVNRVVQHCVDGEPS